MKVEDAKNLSILKNAYVRAVEEVEFLPWNLERLRILDWEKDPFARDFLGEEIGFFQHSFKGKPLFPDPQPMPIEDFIQIVEKLYSDRIKILREAKFMKEGEGDYFNKKDYSSPGLHIEAHVVYLGEVDRGATLDLELFDTDLEVSVCIK